MINAKDLKVGQVVLFFELEPSPTLGMPMVHTDRHPVCGTIIKITPAGYLQIETNETRYHYDPARIEVVEILG